MVPVAPQVDGIVGHDNDVERPGGDGQITARAQVVLGRLIRLDRADRYVEKIAHAITATVAAIAATTMAMSTPDLSWSRNGLNPTASR